MDQRLEDEVRDLLIGHLLHYELRGVLGGLEKVQNERIGHF